MSLTALMADRASRCRQFVAAVGTAVDATSVRHPFGPGLTRLFSVEDLPWAAIREPRTSGAERALLGTALDYRIRSFFGGGLGDMKVAEHGARMLSHQRKRTAAARLVPTFFREVQETLERLAPAGRQLPPSEERELARICLALAHFEVIYRAGREVNSPLFDLPSKAHVGDILALGTPAQVEDLVGLGRDVAEDLLPLAQIPARLNPTFAGSPHVGGADADLIVGAGLFEIKTVKDFELEDWREAFLQVLAYALLDYEDEYGIRMLGLVLPWQRRVIAHPIEVFVIPIAEQLQGAVSADRVDARLAALRSRFREMLTDPEAWTEHGVLADEAFIV